jgi:Asp/Glu/hydantoin racemase
MKRIFVISPGYDLGETQLGASKYMEYWEGAVNKIKGSDTEVVFKVAPVGFWKAPHTVVDFHMFALAIPSICNTIIEAEKNGADAVIIGCTDDPGLRTARTLVDIPVIGETESTMHLACTMGHKFGLVSWPSRPFMMRGENNIKLYGLESRAVANPTEPVVELSPTADKDIMLNGFTDPKSFTEKYFSVAVKNLVKRGAEVVIMHSTGLSLMAATAGFTKVEIDMPTKPATTASVPVLNVVSVALKTAEMMIDLRKLTGLPCTSRVGLYQKMEQIVTNPEDRNNIREFYEHKTVL